MDETGSDRPVAYVGQTDNVCKRIEQHEKGKDFWESAVLFLSTAGGLNRAHTTWLEWSLIARASAAKRCRLLNGATPSEPGLIESEKADTSSFLGEMLRMMPVMGVHLFEQATTVQAPATPLPATKEAIRDTIVVPAQKEGFDSAYLGQNAWWAIRIAAKHRDNLKWIAAYQVSPVAAVTHVAEIDHLEPFGDEGKYKIVFKGPAKPLAVPIPFGKSAQGSMQGPRYTTHERLLKAATISDLL